MNRKDRRCPLLKVKPGVTPSNLVIAAAAANVSHEMGIEMTITAGTDGKHMTGSRHYIGAALDLRSSNLSKLELAEFVKKMGEHLGKAYQVIVETDHVHVEKQDLKS